ncbi:hypothetical protein, partial [Escherichia coli]|uniref:hypothetical protein n=1 Tax=Escherichia coli TaxID=562 RepID=UPI0038902185
CAATHSAVSQPGIFKLTPGHNSICGDYRSKDLTPGCWLRRFLRFISMATREDSKWIYHNPLIVRTAEMHSAQSRQQTGKNRNNPENYRDRA